jgi:hypothetical protein
MYQVVFPLSCFYNSCLHDKIQPNQNYRYELYIFTHNLLCHLRFSYGKENQNEGYICTTKMLINQTCNTFFFFVMFS